MCNESASKALKSHPFDVLSFVVRHSCTDEDKREQVLSTLTHEWFERIRQHISVIMEATGQKNSPILVALKQMLQEARLTAGVIAEAASANAGTAVEQSEVITHDSSVKAKTVPEPIEPIEPYPIKVRRYRTARHYRCTLLLKKETKQTEKSDEPGPTREDVQKAVGEKVQKSSHPEQNSAVEELVDDDWLIHLGNESHAKIFVEKSLLVNGEKFRFQKFGSKLSQVFLCKKIPAGLSYDRMLMSLVAARPGKEIFVLAARTLIVMILDEPDDIKSIDIVTGKRGAKGVKKMRFEVSFETTECYRCHKHHVPSKKCHHLLPLSLTTGEDLEGLLKTAPKVVRR